MYSDTYRAATIPRKPAPPASLNAAPTPTSLHRIKRLCICIEVADPMTKVIFSSCCTIRGQLLVALFKESYHSWRYKLEFFHFFFSASGGASRVLFFCAVHTLSSCTRFLFWGFHGLLADQMVLLPISIYFCFWRCLFFVEALIVQLIIYYQVLRYLPLSDASTMMIRRE